MSDHLPPTLDAAMRLVRATRLGPAAVSAVLLALSPTETQEVAIALAAVVRPDVDLAEALSWCDLPAEEWPETVVLAEWQRGQDGDTDPVTIAARDERERRRAQRLEAHRLASRTPAERVAELEAQARAQIDAETTEGRRPSRVDAEPVRQQIAELADLLHGENAVAQRLGMKPRNLQRILLGKTKLAEADTADRVADLLYEVRAGRLAEAS